MDWKPKSFEDSLLHSYWEKVGGKLYLEVPIGGLSAPHIWSKNSEIRRIDGVLFPSKTQDSGIFSFNKNKEQFLNDVSGASHIQLIEVKKKINRLVVGQALVGKVMFEKQYDKSVQPVVLCNILDSAMKWSCEQLGVAVEIIDK